MIIAFLLTGTMLPAGLALIEPRGEQDEIGFLRLAPVDRFLRNRKVLVLGGFSLLLAVGIALLPFLRFDANPLHLRSTRAESVATFLELMQDPTTSLEKIDVLAPSLDEGLRIAARVSALPDVGQAVTLRSFVPDDQQQKLEVTR